MNTIILKSRFLLLLSFTIVTMSCSSNGMGPIDVERDSALLATKPAGSSTSLVRPGTLLATTNNCCNVNGAPNGTGTLIAIDPETGNATQIALLDDPSVSLAFSHHDGQLYASLTVVTDKARSQLSIIDPANGDIDPIGVIRDAGNGTEYLVAAMGVDHDGVLYAISTTERLLRLNTSTAEAKVVGSLCIEVVNMVFTLADGVFYLFGRKLPPQGGEVTLYSVNLASGASTEIGGTGIFDNALGLSVGPDGSLLGVINDSLYRISRTTGLATLIGSTGFDVLSGLSFVDEIDRLCPCAGPWKNHGEYVSCVAEVSRDLHAAGIITGKQKGQIQAQAAQSECGK